MKTAIEIRIIGVKSAIEHLKRQSEEANDRTNKAFLEGLLAGYESQLSALQDILEIVKVEEEKKHEVV